MSKAKRSFVGTLKIKIGYVTKWVGSDVNFCFVYPEGYLNSFKKDYTRCCCLIEIVVSYYDVQQNKSPTLKKVHSRFIDGLNAVCNFVIQCSGIWGPISYMRYVT